MRTLRRLAVASPLLVIFVAGCGGQGPTPVLPAAVSIPLANSSTAFGVELVDRLLTEPGAGNVFVSPLSATLMLSMAASAAEGQTRTTMLSALGLDPNTDPSAEARQTIESLTRTDPNVQLELAQAVWAESGLPLSPSYVTKLQNDYKAQIANLDFRSRGAPAVVNRWVDNATHHKITQLVDKFGPGVVGYLVNATYFHAMWQNQFDSNGSGDFHTFDGTTAQVAMMKRTENVTLLGSPDYSAVLLPYKGGRFSALLVLPVRRLSPANFAGFLSPASWSQALQYLHRATGASLGGTCTSPDAVLTPKVWVACEGTLVMPKFTLEYKKDLTTTLGEMGMPIPGAILSGFCGDCLLSDVVQKTYLQVDEQGTTAAAAAGGTVVMALPPSVVVDRPFVFGIIDNATDAPLFLGAIGNI